MIIFPAIDIRGGKCVRLIKGDYKQETVYSDSPVEIAKEWEKQGAEYIHIVDLDGAKTGDAKNKEAIASIAKEVAIPVQVGGGIRNLEIVKAHLDQGVARVIIGTAAIHDLAFLKAALDKYGTQIAVSIDARNGYVATDGWTKTSDRKAVDLLQELAGLGVQTVIYTDIMKDGMLKGPNFRELDVVNRATSIDVIASGGVSTKGDIDRLSNAHLYGAIVGKALYEGNLSLEQLLEGTNHDN